MGVDQETEALMGDKLTLEKVLVRDRIPEGITASTGVAPCVATFDTDEEYLAALAARLVELAAGFRDDPSMELLADMQEVTHAYAKLKDCTPFDVERMRIARRAACGGFDGRVALLPPLTAPTEDKAGNGEIPQ